MNKEKYNNELKNITKGAGVTAFSLVFMNMMAFVNNAVITRTVGADQYGLYVLATRVFELVTIASLLGFRQTIVKFLSGYKAKQAGSYIKGTFLYCLKILILVSVVVSVVLAGFSYPISTGLFNKPELSPYLKILLLLVPIQVMLWYFSSSLQGVKKVQQQVTITNVVLPVLFLVFISLAFIRGYRLDGLIYAHILTVTIIAAILYYYSKKNILNPYKKKKSMLEPVALWKFSLPLYLNSFLGTSIRLSPILIMGLFITSKEIGIFNIAFRLAGLVFFMVMAFQLIFAPTISELFAKNEKSMIANLSKSITKWVFTISFGIFILLFVYHKQVLGVFGNDFIEGSSVLFILLVAELINALAGLTFSVILMSGRSKVILINSLVGFVIIVSVTFLLTPVYGILGPAIAYLTFMIVVNSLSLIELWYFEKMHPFRLDFLKPLIAGLFGFTIIYLLPDANFLKGYGMMLIGSVIFGVVYFGLLILFKLSEEDTYLLKIISYQIKSRFRKKYK